MSSKKTDSAHQTLPLATSQQLNALTDAVKGSTVERSFSRVSILLIVLSAIAKGLLIFFLFWYLSQVHATEVADYKHLFRQGRFAETAGDIAKASTLYQQAIEASQGNPKVTAAILYVKASMAQQQQLFASAEVDFQQSLQLRQQYLGTQHPAVAVSLNGLAGLYVALGDETRARTLYEQALQIDEAHFGVEQGGYSLK